MTDVQEFLTSEFFYLVRISRNDAAAYEKQDLLEFDEDGEVIGVDEAYHSWEISGNELLIFNAQKEEILRFMIEEDFEADVFARSDNLHLLLLPVGDSEVLSLKVEADRDRKSLASFTKKSSLEYQQLRDYVANDLTLDGYAAGEYFVVPRKSLRLGFSRDTDLEIDYLLEKPLVSDSAPKTLLVEFHWLEVGNVSAYARMYGTFKRPQHLQENLAPNCSVLRIADSNLISGSYFFNTVNFPDYEEKLQKFIRKIAAQEEIPLENIVCYGYSRGGTAALYHAALGGYSCVAVDPVVDRSSWLYFGRDSQLMFDFLPVSFVDKFSAVLSETKSDSRQLQVLCSENSQAVYPEMLKLNLSRINLENLNINLTKGNLIGNSEQLFWDTIPLQLSMINKLLYKL